MLTDPDGFESSSLRTPWNKGRLVGQKRPLKPKDVWSIRVRLEIAGSLRDLVLFNLAIDSKLRACDLVSLRVDVNTLDCGGLELYPTGLKGALQVGAMKPD